MIIKCFLEERKNGSDKFDIKGNEIDGGDLKVRQHKGNPLKKGLKQWMDQEYCTNTGL